MGQKNHRSIAVEVPGEFPGVAKKAQPVWRYKFSSLELNTQIRDVPGAKSESFGKAHAHTLPNIATSQTSRSNTAGPKVRLPSIRRGREGDQRAEEESQSSLARGMQALGGDQGREEGRQGPIGTRAEQWPSHPASIPRTSFEK